MTRWTRKLRGVMGLAAIGSVTGLALGGAWTVLDALRSPGGLVVWSDIPLWGLFGAVSGAGFAVALAGLESRRTVGEIPIWRAGLWSGLVSASIPLLLSAAWTGGFSTSGLSDVLPAVGVCAGLGGAFGAGLVAAARRQHGRELEDGSTARPRIEAD